MSDLQDALELLREASKHLRDDDSIEAIDKFIEKMEQPIVRVCHDGNPGNPRVEHDNVGIMFCKHRHYTLGDEGALDPYEEVEIYELDSEQSDDANAKQYRIEADRLNQVQEMLSEWHDRIVHEKESEAQQLDAERTFEAYDYLTHLHVDDTEQRLRPGVALIMPLYLYDHSGITISHGSFNDRWDSGQVGWHYMLKEAVDREWNGDLEAARKYMKAELKEYDDFITGNTWGYEIETRSGEHIASCWGFFGDLKDNGMLDNVEEKYRPLLEAAWENRQ